MVEPIILLVVVGTGAAAQMLLTVSGQGSLAGWSVMAIGAYLKHLPVEVEVEPTDYSNHQEDLVGGAGGVIVRRLIR